MSARPAEGIAVPAWERYALTALFGSLIVAAYAYQAWTMAASLGWVAYLLVAATGAASFLIARAAWSVLVPPADSQSAVQEDE